MSRNRYLVAAAICCLCAALAHLGCIVFGGDWYRFFGAGEQMALLAEQGHWYPTVITLFISLMLVMWALYALSGAGVLRRLPLLRPALCVISAIFLLRGLAFLVIMPMFPGNSLMFWWVSSAICLLLGVLFAAGTIKVWRRQTI
ncbi:hypothetical protein SAMN06297280_0459 [Arsukibacterium tuosuense]|uniref:Uncharacterized protein n=1 Tax=Arsukibacterium tuosuense TaxID=1323745 RepID=A0A285I3M9_9GAMM|nr:hypothetical protein [Arsukibacterium tuosuense]SNY42559.1 hypothetical protein SAMN06297280_0459 [Arsukibacterium tuosuense]